MPPIRKAVDWRKQHEMKKKRKSREIEEYLEANIKLQKEVAEETFDREIKPDENSVHKVIRTLSIALPGSILDSIPCPELQTYVVGQIARAACIYNVDEIIIFDDTCGKSSEKDEEGNSISWLNCEFFAKILRYLECPQYLRKMLFPKERDLQYVGLLNPVEAPHHFRANQHSLYREGVVTDEKNKKGTKSLAEIGLINKVKLDKILEPGTRVTVKLPPKNQGAHKLNGISVSPWEPKVKLGMYWGYNVRLASSITDVFGKCPYKKGYNLTIGTSDKGTPINDINFKKKKKLHLLIVFGGLKGLEFALESDDKLDVDDVRLLFDHYVNTCPNQGTRTIRTEEAILISLAVITGKFCLEPKEDSKSEENINNGD
ncbi:hypothetical protein O3M35_010246 [Rhynocoris fuscipes]|uniref:Uncharacterized protein n=1 Tax=Rhynocoris fuscipes TaxID=488301 RepID=A0AAW1D118_9HEMI